MPKLLTTPFATDAPTELRTDIQVSTGAAPNSATYQQGFPANTMEPITAGGIPPKGSDFNGIFYDITDNLVFLTQGNGYPFDAAYATSIGGYPLNARLRLDNGDIVRSTVAGNTTNPNIDMTGWSIGLPASLINDGGLNQHEINRGVDSVADMLNIPSPIDGQRVYVKSYYVNKNLGGGWFVYDSSKSSINDNGVVIDGWVRVVDDIKVIEASWFGLLADGVTDDQPAIMRAINYLCPVAYQGNWNSTSDRSSGTLRLPSGNILIKSQILLPPYIKMIGKGARWYFAGSSANFTTLIPDFTDVYQFAVQSATYVVATGALISNAANYSGTSGFDQRTITATHGIELSDFNINPKSQILGGIRLVCAPKSSIKRVFINNVDIACKIDASWASKFDITSQHFKAGLFLGFDSNACDVDGYYTGDQTKPCLTNNYWKSILQSYDPSTGLSNNYASNAAVFGVINYWNQGCNIGTLVSEGNTISLFNSRGNAVVDVLYSEKNTWSSVVGFNGNVEIGEITGVKDVHTYEVGINSIHQLHNDNQTQVSGGRVVSVSEFGGALYVPANFNYTITGVFLNNPSAFVFVNGTTGSNTNTGGVGTPVASIDEALRRLSSVRSLSSTTITMPNANQKEIVILDSSAYTLSNRFTVHGYISIRGTQTGTKASITFNQPIILNSCDFIISSINLNRGAVDFGSGENGCLWLGDGRNSVTAIGCDVNLGSYSFLYPYYLRAGIVDFTMRNSAITGSATNTIIQSASGNDELHLFNIVLKSVTYSGGVEGRADKGFAFPAANRGWIKGITLP